LFSKVRIPVCTSCADDEEADYDRIRSALRENSGLKPAEVAELAKVSTECVMRMISQGLVDHLQPGEAATCGRCGAPAISASKRLCDKCLIQLDQECAEAMHDMKARARDELQLGMHITPDLVGKGSKDARSPIIPKFSRDGAGSPAARRMAVRDRLVRESEPRKR